MTLGVVHPALRKPGLGVEVKGLDAEEAARNVLPREPDHRRVVAVRDEDLRGCGECPSPPCSTVGKRAHTVIGALHGLWIGRHRTEGLVVIPSLSRQPSVVPVWIVSEQRVLKFPREIVQKQILQLPEAEQQEAFQEVLHQLGTIRVSLGVGGVARQGSPRSISSGVTGPRGSLRQAAETANRVAIEEFAKTRGIRSLVHFTRVENVASILERGLLSRLDLGRKEIRAVINDRERFDRHLGAISLSIEFPNYKMFFKVRQESQGSLWAVLGLGPDVLWTQDCAFYPENAAARRSRKTPLRHARSSEALREIYLETWRGPTGTVRRRSLGIADHYPTNPQAEVLSFAPISADKLIFVALKSPAAVDRLRSMAPQLEGSPLLRVESTYFRPRSDHRYWSGESSPACDE